MLFINSLHLYIIRWEGRNNKSFNLPLIAGGLVGLLGFGEIRDTGKDQRGKRNENLIVVYRSQSNQEEKFLRHMDRYGLLSCNTNQLPGTQNLVSLKFYAKE